MPLTTEQREAAWAEFRDWLEEDGPVAFDKPVLRRAVTDAIGWVESPAVRTAYNAALSEPFRSAATVNQKAFVLMVALRHLYRS